eukprot:4223014-Pyramimonas_sp.AAC.1
MPCKSLGARLNSASARCLVAVSVAAKLVAGLFSRGIAGPIRKVRNILGPKDGFTFTLPQLEPENLKLKLPQCGPTLKLEPLGKQH